MKKKRGLKGKPLNEVKCFPYSSSLQEVAGGLSRGGGGGGGGGSQSVDPGDNPGRLGC